MEACKAFMYGQTFIILCDVTWWSKQTMVADMQEDKNTHNSTTKVIFNTNIYSRMV